MLVIWWWFKPLYELPMILFLSRALFAEQLSLRATWMLAFTNMGKMFTTYLTVARLSTARALTYGVVFLEQMPRKQRSARIQTLTMVPTKHYLLMLVCLHIEYILAYAIITTTAVVLFSGALGNVDWSNALTTLESPEIQLWLVAASVTTLVAAALVAPFYVTGGFLIYINRRMQIEAWDIEHRFRGFKPRKNAPVIATMVLAICLGSISDLTTAAERAKTIPTPVATSDLLENILSQDDFGYTKKQWVPKFDFNWEEDQENDFLDLLESGSTTTFAKVIKALLWIAIVLFLILLLYTLRGFRRPELTRNPLSRTGKDIEDAKNHPLTQNLPTDIAAAAEQLLQQGQRRQALSVLFRGALRSIMDEHELKISRGATESDCSENVSSVGSEHQVKTFGKLLRIWQKEAYANQPQDTKLISTLIEDWKNAFGVQNSQRPGQSEQVS